MLLPAAIAADTLESLIAEQGPDRSWVYRLLLLGIVGALASLPFVQVDLALRVPGIVRPAVERIEIRPAVSGLVTRVLAHDNETVQEGQALLVISSDDLASRLAHNRACQDERLATIADLQRATSLAEDAAGGGWETDAFDEEWSAYLAEREACRLTEDKAALEQDRCTVLAGKGIATQQELDNTRFEAERRQVETELVTARAHARWEARLQEESTALAQLESDERRMEDERDRFTVRAPAAGVLVGFAGWSAGGFLAAGQLLGSVSPDDALLVEAQVSSRDAGLVSVGQAARLQVDAYTYTWWGTLDGVVTSISGDAIQPEGARIPGFKVTIRPFTTHLSLANGRRASLRKGLTVSTRLVVARRSLLQLLYDESGAWLNPQDRHPA